jgi:hypothetical protein
MVVGLDGLAGNDDGAGEAPDRVARLDDGDLLTLALQRIGGREPGHAGADDDAVRGVWHRRSVATIASSMDRPGFAPGRVASACGRASDCACSPA